MSAFVWFFLSLTGRIGRQEYWLGYGAVMIVALLLPRALQGFILDIRRPPIGPWNAVDLERALALPRVLTMVFLFWPLCAICVKRLHDLNLSGWWLLAWPGLVLAAKIVMPDSSITGLAVLAVLGLIPGSPASNRFGEAPFGHARG